MMEQPITELQILRAQLTAMTARANENERKLREVCQAHGVALIELHDRNQEIERLKGQSHKVIRLWELQVGPRESISFRVAMKDLRVLAGTKEGA